MPTTPQIGNARRRRTWSRVLTLSFLVMLALGGIALTLAIGPQGAPDEFGLTEQSQTRM